MRAEEKIYRWLSSYAPLTALVGTRIAPAKRQQAQQMPNVTYRRLSTAGQAALDGDHGFALVPIEIETQAETWDEAREIARLIRKCLKQKAHPIDFDEDVDEEREPVTYYYTQEYQVSEKEDIE